MGVTKPDKDHYSRNMSMIWGVDPADGKWASVSVDASGFIYTKGYVKNYLTLEWEAAVQQSDMAQYKLSDMDVASDPCYFGYVDADGNWFIMQLNEASGTARYVKGTSGYTTAWTARASQTYGYYNAVF